MEQCERSAESELNVTDGSPAESAASRTTRERDWREIASTPQWGVRDPL